MRVASVTPSVLRLPYRLEAAADSEQPTRNYYLRSEKDYQSLAYPPRLAVDLGSYVDGEAHGWAR